MKKNNKVLLIGWDAADWKTINPMIDEGLLPNLEALINRGSMGNLATLDPPLSPMLWTSIATGKRPYKHGILGFTEPRPDGSGIQPVLNTSRKCKAIWNILNQSGYRPNVVGWWPSHPAEPIDGVYVSNFYQKANLPKEPSDLASWYMMRRTIHPQRLHDTMAALRVHPWELTGAHLSPFVQEGHKIDQSDTRHQKMLTTLRKIIADSASVHSAATYILENEEWDFMGVYYDAIDHFGHGFMKFHPPKRDHIPQDFFDIYHNVITAGYRYHDMLLGQLLSYTDEETTVLLISDHGFHDNHLRPKGLPKIPAAPAIEHSPYGIFLAAGPNIKKDHLIHGASLLDITPTLLKLYDLPTATDMDGRALDDIFIETPPDQVIDSWESVKGYTGAHRSEILKDNWINQEALDQLIELGYINKPDENIEKAILKNINETQFWLAKSYIDGGVLDMALPILQKLFTNYPDAERYGFLLVKVYRGLKQPEKAKEVLKLIRGQAEHTGPFLLVLEAKSLVNNGKAQEARDKLIKAESMAGDSIGLYMHIAQVYMQLKEYFNAEQIYRKIIKLDFQNDKGYSGLASTYYYQGLYEKAAQQFVESLALNYHQPLMHYYLGECLEKLGDQQGAMTAYNASLQLNKNAQSAKLKLRDLYAQDEETFNKAKELNQELLDLIEGEILVVSGLPRSGTSLMMQILEKHGVQPFTDKIRRPDDNNPRGYYEHEEIKSLMKDRTILDQVGDNSIKIIAQLLRYLPLKYRYKVIFMDRDLDEIINSQSKMLKRLEYQGNKTDANRNKNHLKAAYTATLKKVASWAQTMPNVDIIHISYNDLIVNPRKELEKLSHALGKDIDIDNMATAIDPSLYREKTIAEKNRK